MAEKSFGYLGPNGAGKTTTIRILLDLIRADAGRAEIFGLDVRKRSLDVRRRVGFLPGELNLYEDLTCEGLLRFFAGLRGNIDWSYVEELASRLGCHLSQPIDSLSLGNKRKLGLIQAFMHRPDLLILDEPTSGLDPLVRHEFFRLVAEARAAGQTVFFSSHNLPEVARVCDRVAIIRSGRLVALEECGRSQVPVAAHRGDPLRRGLRRAGVFTPVAGLEITALDKRSLKGRMTGRNGPATESGGTVQDRAISAAGNPDLEDVFSGLSTGRMTMAAELFRKTLREQRWALLGWSVRTGLHFAFPALFLPFHQPRPANVLKVLDNLPPFIRNLIGKNNFMATPEGFLNLQPFSILAPLLFIIFAIGKGGDATAGEEERGTLDLLLSHPLPRWRLVLEKFAAQAAALLYSCPGFLEQHGPGHQAFRQWTWIGCVWRR